MSEQYCSFDYTVEGCRRFKSSSHKFIKEARWMRGAMIDETAIPKPYPGMLFPFDERTDKHIMPEIVHGAMPIMREDLILALREAGVDNLQLFDVSITDPESGTVYTNYKAVNIVGCIKVADLKKSVYTQHGNGPLLDVDFDKLVIEDAKGCEQLMFRMAESVNVILLHKKVRDYLLTKNFPFLRFYELGDIAT